MKRDLRGFLLLQVFFMVVALLSFRLIEVRWQAAAVAGLGFVTLGFWMMVKTIRWPEKFRTFSFYLARLHMVFALSMIWARFVYMDSDFSHVRILGIPGPQFHRWSEMVYLALVVGTALDLLLLSRRKKSVA